MQPNEVRVLVVEDDAKIREAWGAMIRSTPDMKIVGLLSSADHLLEECRNSRPHVVLLDLKMPGRDALEALSETLTVLPETRTVVYTALSDQRLIRKAIEAGAWAYMDKLEEPNAVVDTIRRIARMSAPQTSSRNSESLQFQGGGDR